MLVISCSRWSGGSTYLFSTRANATHVLRGLTEARDGRAELIDLEELADRLGVREAG